MRDRRLSLDAGAGPFPNSRSGTGADHGSLVSRLTSGQSVRQNVCIATTTGTSEVWQARIGHEFAAQLREDSAVLGLDGRTDIVKAGLQLLHRRAGEERMARSVDEFYHGVEPPLPIGVPAADDDEGVHPLDEDASAGPDGCA